MCQPAVNALVKGPLSQCKSYPLPGLKESFQTPKGLLLQLGLISLIQEKQKSHFPTACYTHGKWLFCVFER